MSSYQQPCPGIDAGTGDIGVGLVSGDVTEYFGEGSTLGTTGPHHSEGTGAGAAFTVGSALRMVLGNGKL